MSISHRPYKYNDMNSDLIRNRMLNFLKVRLVELSHKEYATIIIIPSKKDMHGNYMNIWMCENYHLINWHTNINKYFMFTYDKIFDMVRYVSIFSTLDLKKIPLIIDSNE